MVEHSLGKGEVAGPIPAMGTMTDLSAQLSGVYFAGLYLEVVLSSTTLIWTSFINSNKAYG